MKNTFQNLIKEICLENNIKCNIISNEWVIVLEKNKQKRIISGYKFDNNRHGLGMLLDDKFATYEYLKLLNIPIIEHNILYTSYNMNEYASGCNSYEYLKKLFEKYNKNIVIKSNNGTGGSSVWNINEEMQLYEFFINLKSKSASYSVCPFYNIENEYRVIILNNEIELVYKKELPVVWGNGNSTIKELLMKFNYEYFKDYNKDNKDDILSLGEKYVYNWKFNLAGGARASIDVPKENLKKISEIAKDVAHKINLGFCSIDIIKTFDNNYFIMEINSGVMMKNFINEIPNGYSIAKNIYANAILSLFD